LSAIEGEHTAAAKTVQSSHQNLEVICDVGETGKRNRAQVRIMTTTVGKTNIVMNSVRKLNCWLSFRSTPPPVWPDILGYKTRIETVETIETIETITTGGYSEIGGGNGSEMAEID
jgi:hypothetical protein